MADDWGGVMAMLLLVGGGIWVLQTHPEFLIPKAQETAAPALPTTTTPTTGKAEAPTPTPKPKATTSSSSSAPGLSSAPAAAGKTIYAATGKTQIAKGTGPKTRHYASGKPNDTTQEWNAANCPFENYEMTIGVNIGKPDHDDTVSLKMLGPTHQDGKGAWHIVDIGFMKGDFSMGHEKPHPTTKSHEVNGQAMGSIVGKDVQLKAVIYKIGSGHHVEGWGMVGGAWKKMVQGDNVGGVFQKDPAQNVQFRIDAAPQVKVSQAIVQEITPPSGGAAKTSAAAAAYSIIEPWDGDQYRQEIEFTFRKDCGMVCADIDFM